MGSIDITTAKEMVQRYTDSRRVMIDKTYSMRDTRAIWFSMDQVNAFMASLPANATGVRIYLGVHDEGDPVYPFQTTIIAIGTVEGPSGNNIDPVGSKDGFIGGPVPVQPYNHGDLCPPNADCA